MPSRQERFKKAAKTAKRKRQEHAAQIEIDNYLIEQAGLPENQEALREYGLDPDELIEKLRKKNTDDTSE